MSQPFMKESRNNQTKKPFNKRAYLRQKLRKNFGSLQEGHGRAFLQKKAIVKQYHREQKKEEGKQRKKLQYEMSKGKDSVANLNHPETYNPIPSASTEPDEEKSPFTQPLKKRKLNSMQRARAEYHKKVAERKKKQEEHLRRQAEIEAAKKKYRENRLKKFKKLNQKTRKGQPVMKGRIDLMLETLQNEMKL